MLFLSLGAENVFPVYKVDEWDYPVSSLSRKHKFILWNNSIEYIDRNTRYALNSDTVNIVYF